jgi:hypothetical protein
LHVTSRLVVLDVVVVDDVEADGARAASDNATVVWCRVALCCSMFSMQSSFEHSQYEIRLRMS